MADLRALPLFVYILIVFTLMMFVPAVFAAVQGDFHSARVFVLNATVLLTIITILALAVINRKPRSSGRLHLITLLAAYLVVPLICTFPFSNLVPFISFSQAYFEMMSSMTTTGATLFWDPSAISETLHLWRGLVGWMGGFLILAAALAILEPLNLGGFEIRTGANDQPLANPDRNGRSASDRVIRVVRRLAPIYIMFTALLFVLLVMAGDRPFVAFCHAIATISTSGISPIGGLQNGDAGLLGEIPVMLFFAFAISHHLFDLDKWRAPSQIFRGPEFGVALRVSLLASALILLGLIYSVAIESEETRGLFDLRTVWGVVFTTVSFLSTTGFTSGLWDIGQYHGTNNSIGLFFVCLAFLGGGIATTAGGLKLLRVYVLYKHSERELERLVHPNSVAGFGSDARYIRREGAYVTWMFAMLFILSIAFISLALSLCGLSFQSAFVLTIASLSNTGPLPALFSGEIETYAALSDNARMYLDISMIIGRMEVLAVVALVNTTLWQR